TELRGHSRDTRHPGGHGEGASASGAPAATHACPGSPRRRPRKEIRMTTRIDCETLRQYRDEYLRGDSPNELVESHLAECPSCLEAFLDVTLATPTDVEPPWGFATRVVPSLPPEPRSGARRRVILVISALLGMAMSGFSMVLGDTAA